MRNLRHLILREHKVDKEEELNETVDPIKRVRQQLDKVQPRRDMSRSLLAHLAILGPRIHLRLYSYYTRNETF